MAKKSKQKDGTTTTEELNESINGTEGEVSPEAIVPDTIFKFGFPFHKACSTDQLRPAMNFIRFYNGFLLATDGIMLIKVSLADLGLSEEVIGNLEGYYLHRLQFAMIWNKEVEIIDGHVTAILERVEAPLQTNSDVLKDSDSGMAGAFPNIDDVIRNMGPNMGLKTLGLSGSVANNFFSIFKECQMKIEPLVATATEYMLKITMPHRLPNSEAYLSPIIID